MALDLAFAALEGNGSQGSPLLIVGATATTTVESLDRGLGQIAFVDDSWLADHRGNQRLFSRSLWIAPEASTWQPTAALIDSHLAPGGRLVVVGSGNLAALLSRLRPGTLGIHENAARPGAIRQHLGYRAISEWRLYGIASARWALLRIIADRLRRSDLADRYQAAFQLSLIGPGASRLSGITVLATEKSAEPKAAKPPEQRD